MSRNALPDKVTAGILRNSSEKAAGEARLLEFGRMVPDQAVSALGSTFAGLSSEEAEARLERHGPNELSHLQRRGVVAELLHRLRSPLVIQLLLISLVSAIIGEYEASVIVGGMIALSVGLSFALDSRSSRAVESLGRRIQPRAFVLRDGKETEVRISELVPGDIVLLQTGSVIPADLRIISAKDFFVSESALTGESMPVEKSPAPVQNANSALELPNACFLGASVISGIARGVVVNTGSDTLFGAIAEKLAAQREETAFDKGIRSFTFLMIRFMSIMVAVVFLIVGITKGDWVQALLFGLSVSVGLVPAMLPMILTVNLAKGALAMARKKVIVKQLPAIQNFGAIDILCTDKTGTLTQDRVVLERHVDILGHESEDVLNYAYLNSYFQTGLRSLIDRAILDAAELDPSGCRLVDELPFDFQRRRMSVVVEYEETMCSSAKARWRRSTPAAATTRSTRKSIRLWTSSGRTSSRRWRTSTARDSACWASLTGSSTAAGPRSPWRMNPGWCSWATSPFTTRPRKPPARRCNCSATRACRSRS